MYTYRSQGLRCGRLCHPTAVSQEWRVNNDLSPFYHGTWRERKGLHDFMDLALAPQRNGMFDSAFWTDTVMQLVLANAAVFHVASGIGALREHLMRTNAGETDAKGSALAFGLRQCNKAINMLKRAARDGSQAYSDPGIALIVCILFTIFEALYGDSFEALTHVIQGRKILWRCEQFPAGHGGSSVVDVVTARPVLSGLQFQATCLSGQRASEVSCQVDPLPLPEIDIISSLEQANRSLHVVYSNLLLYHQDVQRYVAGSGLSISATQKRLRFLPWLKLWEKGFANHLFAHSSTLSVEDMQKAKVLKANHMLSVILAQVDTTGDWQAWEPFTAEFKTIIDLAAAVLNIDQASRRIESDTIAGMPAMSFGLWIAEPLFVCLSRCTDSDLRSQAAGLLNGLPRRSKSSSLAPSPPSRSEIVSGASSSSNGDGCDNHFRIKNGGPTPGKPQL